METGVLHRDDNLTVLKGLPDESVDLIYLDPPFFSNRIYEVIWGEEAEVRSFEDRWAGGIANYIEWMKARAVELHRVLKPTGFLFIHSDPHASHYLKVMLDELFELPNFRSEIVWKRYSSHNDAKWNLAAIHDSLLFYGKTPEAAIRMQYVAHDPVYVEQWYRNEDPDGRRWQSQNLASPNPRPNLTYAYKALNGVTYEPPPNGWKCKPERMRELDEQERLVYPGKPTGRLRVKNYLDEMKGSPLSDLWTDIRSLTGAYAERLGYPTQKPEALLERIIQLASSKGDLVLDPFCGCGTTVAVAERLQRDWIGIDISATAIQVMERRLLKQGRRAKVVNAVETIADLKALKPFEFQNWIINAIFGSHSARPVKDMGIDGYTFFTKDPVQVKQQEKVGRETLDKFETAVRRSKHTVGYVIGFSFTRDAVEEAARAKKDGLDIRLVKVAEVMMGVKRPHGKQALPLPATVEELPMPPARKPKDLPTVEELIESDLAVGGGTVRHAAAPKTRGPRSRARRDSPR